MRFTGRVTIGSYYNVAYILKGKYISMKTILHTIDTTGPGGAETVFLDLATRLPKERYRSVVVIRGKGWVYDELCRRGLEPILLDAKGSFNLRYLLGLRKIIQNEGVDLIQSHLLGTNVYCSLVGLLTGKPVIATFHGAVDIGDKERFLGLKFGLINQGASKIIAVSDSLRDEIVIKTPLKKLKTDVIHNGIDTTAFERHKSDELKQQFGWGQNDIIVGSLGNVRAAKGYDVLLRAAARLVQSENRFRFVIAGQGKSNALYKRLLKLSEDLELRDRVEFLGFVDDPAWFLSNLDLYLLPSISEGFSISTIQAMASGVPVIVTRSGGPEEIVTHQENGWIVDKGNPAAIVDALELLGAHPDICANLSIKGKEKAVNRFSMDAMLGKYENIYAEFC
jgi:glycosyltransferase involved in cell wall biosynthesis